MKTPCRLSPGSWQFRDRGFSASLSWSWYPGSARGGRSALSFEALRLEPAEPQTSPDQQAALAPTLPLVSPAGAPLERTQQFQAQILT